MSGPAGAPRPFSALLNTSRLLYVLVVNFVAARSVKRDVPGGRHNLVRRADAGSELPYGSTAKDRSASPAAIHRGSDRLLANLGCPSFARAWDRSATLSGMTVAPFDGRCSKHSEPRSAEPELLSTGQKHSDCYEVT